MDTGQLLAVLGGAGGVISTLAGLVFKLMTDRISALETENATLRSEARDAVKAKDAEITTLRDIAAKLADERARELSGERRRP